MRYLFAGNTVLEQRYEPRYKTRLAIYYGPREEKIMTDYAVNVSTGGIFIETVKPMPVDTALYVEFMLPATDSPIACKSRVAWINEPGEMHSSDHPIGMGLQFFGLSLENIHAIRDFIDENGLEPTW